MEYNSLLDLITYLEYGTNLHIGVLFFKNYGNEKLILPHKQTIHKTQICDYMKAMPSGLKRCFTCRNLAIGKAMRTKQAFGGLCINGIFEYTHPVIENNDVICIIFISNIRPQEDQTRKIRLSLSNKPELIDTLEQEFDTQKCKQLASILESYIRMIIQLYPAELTNNDVFDPMIENIKNYIESNLEYDLRLSHIARLYGYNAKYLGRFFKKKTGLSFSEYINKRRVALAAELFAQCDDAIIDIAGKVGFNNVTYFNRIFKKIHGITPSEYRTANCTQSRK